MSGRLVDMQENSYERESVYHCLTKLFSFLSFDPTGVTKCSSMSVSWQISIAIIAVRRGGSRRIRCP